MGERARAGDGAGRTGDAGVAAGDEAAGDGEDLARGEGDVEALRDGGAGAGEDVEHGLVAGLDGEDGAGGLEDVRVLDEVRGAEVLRRVSGAGGGVGARTAETPTFSTTRAVAAMVATSARTESKLKEQPARTWPPKETMEDCGGVIRGRAGAGRGLRSGWAGVSAGAGRAGATHIFSCAASSPMMVLRRDGQRGRAGHGRATDWNCSAGICALEKPAAWKSLAANFARAAV